MTNPNFCVILILNPEFVRFSMKKELDIVRCCANCEWAERRGEEDDPIYCHKKKKDREPSSTCRKFSYDLLKRAPMRPREIPTLDPSLLEL